MKFEQDFKDAISELSDKEKDKLILRLLKRDIPLAKRLYFELVSTQTAEELRSEMETRLKQGLRHVAHSHFGLGDLMMELRGLSGEISAHVNTTKDKVGEVSLSLLLVNQALQDFIPRIDRSSPVKAHKLCIYIVSKCFKILILIQALHEDYLVEFREDLEQLGKLIWQSRNLSHTAIHNGLDLNWLLSGDLPENVKAIHAAIRKQGFLR
ncbi:MAG: hypothetical protein A3D31_06485 [Candidatus Fluviicola riflensis]|nr:MAG: hypothetical protein CHH17_08525 [Candidatus Fluviicola riflensis]OGS79609.1 MAG: hypothetical protein A3D31_06485 [Candidatus Fluviicola riflensis]OGS87040.1 MAG: hypothetical protein A2724_05945 [Fluviicola sp. RIFCSPHIGHO2_01_FULL_43_53]OGS89832.1 MAG: hypothetical protein A3E30_02695 [Fluviicola sp. RIFCSPHIGHO2_12_FULL_43_24]